MIATTLISSCHWETLVPFSLKQTELSENHTEQQFMLSKTTVNWLFNDI